MNRCVQIAVALLAALTCVFGHCAQAQSGQPQEVIVQVDRNPVRANESFTLTFTLEGTWRVSPDFAPLAKDFEVLQQSQSSSVQMGSGAASMEQVWTLTVLPKRTGSLQIPSIRFGGSTSSVVAIEVLAASQDDQAAKDFLVEVEVSPAKVYVQQQVLVTVRAMRAARISGHSLDELSLSGVDTVVERLVDNRVYQSRRGGRVYEIREFVYAVFPQASGTLFVDPVKYEIEVPGQRWRSQVQRVFSDAAQVSVEPVPGAFSGAVWLPSTDVQIQEEWPTEPPLLRAGEAVTRTLVLSAAGLTAVQLPPLESVAPQAFKQYSDQPLLENGVTQNGVIGMRKEQMALLPTQPGRYALPAVEVAWWDTSASEMRVARLAERWVEVLPGAPGTAQQILGQPAVDATSAAVQALPEAIADAGVWRLVSVIAGVGWLLTSIALVAVWRGRRGASVAVPKPVRKNTASVRKATAQVRSFAASNAMPETRDALLAWGMTVWPEIRPASLGELARLCEQPLAGEIASLSRALYGTGSEAWQGQSLAAAVSRFKASAKAASDDDDQVLATL